MENKVCKQCNGDFVVEDEDSVFYEKISPEFGGKKYLIPSPTLCPECRQIRRLMWRNERSLYKRKCDKTGKDIISIYSPDKTEYKIFDRGEWWKDDWEAMQYGRDYDPTQQFFPQFDQLLKAVPRNSLFNSNTENCDYANYIDSCKNCYMSFVTYYQSENVHYSYWLYNSKNSLDCHIGDKLEKCYNCVLCFNCYDCRDSLKLIDCRNCYYSFGLTGCSDCVLCTNLKHKQYHIENVQYTKAEYEQKLKSFNFNSELKAKQYQEQFKDMTKNVIVKYTNQVNCENCTGNDNYDSKNALDCFMCQNTENSRYSFGQEAAKNCYDSMGGTYEWCYEVNHVGLKANNCLFCSGVLNSTYNMYYSEWCHGCHDCFGCAGLRNKSYCVFNKQFSPEEYGQLVGQIVENMIEAGEWGEFFPVSLSPFGYNETIANYYFPKTREEALSFGAKWQEIDYGIKYDGPFYEPHDDIEKYIQSKDEVDKLLAGILKCEVSGKPFKIMAQELAFYLENKTPIPRRHYDVRFEERFKMRTPNKLWHRQCMCEGQELSVKDQGSSGGCEHEGRCTNMFETTYAPERTEKVYCEGCYRKAVI